MRLNKYEKKQVKNAINLVVLSVIVVFFLTYYSGQLLTAEVYDPGVLTDCGSDQDCFAERSSECKLTESRTTLTVGTQRTVLFNEVQGKNTDGLCVVFSRVESTTVQSLFGKEMTCALNMEQVAGNESVDYRESCTGSFVDAVAPPI